VSRSSSRLPLYLLVAIVVVFLIAPMLIVVPMSFSDSSELRFPPTGFSTRWYERFFADPLWTNAAVTSLQVGLATVVVSTVLGTLAALGLTRGHYPARAIINGLILSPLVVPVVIIAIGMYFVFVDWRIAGTLPGLVAAHSVLAIPFVIVNVSVSLRTIDRNLELAAQNLGANPWRTFRRITLPLILPGIAAGAAFAFITSWDEVVVAIFLSSPLVRTLPVVMWSQVRSVIDPTIAAVATIVMVVTTVSLLLILAVRQRTGART
jgi:putative spermidine/putrescine transport system permease protein